MGPSTNTILTAIVMFMDKTQQYKLDTQNKLFYIDSIYNGNGNRFLSYEIISGNITGDSGKKLMCC